jgi:hypothetical protein
MRIAIASSSIISPDAAKDPLTKKIIDSDGNFVTLGTPVGASQDARSQNASPGWAFRVRTFTMCAPPATPAQFPAFRNVTWRIFKIFPA